MSKLPILSRNSYLLRWTWLLAHRRMHLSDSCSLAGPGWTSVVRGRLICISANHKHSGDIPKYASNLWRSELHATASSIVHGAQSECIGLLPYIHSVWGCHSSRHTWQQPVPTPDMSTKQLTTVMGTSRRHTLVMSCCRHTWFEWGGDWSQTNETNNSSFLMQLSLLLPTMQQ